MILEKLRFYWLAFFGIILIRYVLIAGGAYVFFYSRVSRSLLKWEERTQTSRWHFILQDIRLSIVSAVIFALAAAAVMLMYDAGSTLLYSDFGQYSWWYLGLSFIAVLVLQDAYFYLIHRLFHHPWLFKRFHQGHHRSGTPTPWTSFAFDPPEALIQGLFLVGIVFVVPLHFVTATAVLITMTLWAVFNHLGCELQGSYLPPWLSRWFIGPAHHLVHHRKYRVHYGLYFTVWDYLLGTQDPAYDGAMTARLQAVVSIKKSGEPCPPDASES